MRNKTLLMSITTILLSLFLTMLFSAAAFADEIPTNENCQGAVETAQEYAAGEEVFIPAECSGFNYVVSVTDINGNSVDVAGGGETLISDILRNLGYEVGDDSAIDVNTDSIDADTIDVALNMDGELVLTNKGPFGKASKNLILYLNGETVELTLVDPTEISGEQTAGNIGTAFGGEDLNVRLSGDVTVTDDASINLAAGTHDLYLNGYTLNGRNDATTALFEIGNGVTLNVYGGADANSIGSGAIEAIKAIFRVIGNGILNIFGGSFSSADGATVQAAGGTANIVDGNFSGSGADVSAATGTVKIAGGCFDNDPSAFLLDSAKFGVTESGGSYTVAIKTDADTRAVGIYDGSMAAHATINNAIIQSGYVRLLRNSNEKISIYSGKTVTLDLNGFVLKGTADGSVISNDGKFTLKDLNPLAEHYFAYSKNNAWKWIENPTEIQKSGAIELADVDDTTAEGTAVRIHGGIITGGNSDMGGGIDSTEDNVSCSFVMNGGTVIGNKATRYGGGIRTGGTESKFIINGGAVIGNYSAMCAGGVFGDFYSDFTLNGGSISHNISDKAGGVYTKGKSFIMNGGIISGNIANNPGGGVRADTDFIMNSGTISGNSAESGGGVLVNSSFVMNGGTISSNNATNVGGGIAFFSLGNMSVSRNATVTGNTLSDGTTTSNVYLTYGKTISVMSDFSGSIGVSTEVVPELDAPVPVTSTNSGRYSRCFFSDSNAYSVFNEDDIVKLGFKPEILTGTDSAAANVIIVEAIKLSRLNDKIQSAITSTFSDRLVTPVDSYLLIAGNRVDPPSEQRFTLTFKTALFDGRLPSELRLWKVNDNGTFTEISFSVDELGQIVVENMPLGYYVLTLA